MNFHVLLTTVLLFIASLSCASAIPLIPNDFNVTKRHQTPIPYGIIITHCNMPGVVALTFDDGPYIYTSQILETLSQHGARATFFLNGANKGNIDSYPELLQRAINEGHQLGSHTYMLPSHIPFTTPTHHPHLLTISSRWGHPSLDTLSYPEILSQMTDLESAFLRILGFYPTYMRAPYLMVTADVLAAMTQLEYHVIGASIDTKDYENDHPEHSWRSFEKFRAELDAGGTIVLAHDTHRTTVEMLVENMIGEIEERGYESKSFFSLNGNVLGLALADLIGAVVTIGECLGDPEEFWYRDSR